MKYIVSIFSVLLYSTIYCQIVDDFSDSDFTTNPIWGGTDSIFRIDNEKLRLDASVSGLAYLTTHFPSTSLNNKEWRVWVKQSFLPSANNHSKFYLAVDNNDLNNQNLNAYYLQLGESGSNDAVRLMYQNNSNTIEICSSNQGQIAASFEISIKITRDNNGNWELYVDEMGGDDFNLEATGFENSINFSNKIGVFCRFTNGNISKFYFDNIYFGNKIVDTIPPKISSISVVDENNLTLSFNEQIIETTLLQANNYTVNNFIGNPSSVSLNPNDSKSVQLTFLYSFQNGLTNTLTINNISDLKGNIASLDTSFLYFIPEIPLESEVIITEFLCDPLPQIGLKNAEFVELYNNSNKIFDLQNWKIGDASSQGTINSYILKPNQYVILTLNSNLDSFVANNVVGVSSFPSLNNSGDEIILQYNNIIIDQLIYTKEWYKDEDKEDGGWTIEIINLKHPCSNIDNWNASINKNGGTPGVLNSVNDTLLDVKLPEIKSCFSTSPNHLEITFTEAMDSVSLKNNAINLSSDLSIENRYILSKYTNQLILKFSEEIPPSINYNFSIENATDCWGNKNLLHCNFVLPEIPDSFDLIINEVLFNPYTGGSDFVEIYNRSKKYVNLKYLYLANIQDDSISNKKKLSDNNIIIQPNDYKVLTLDSTDIKTNYINSKIGSFVQLSSMPNYSNEKGTVVLLDKFLKQLDRFSYTKDMHLSLIDDLNGKSLERLDPNRPTNEEGNWHTAAEQVSWATPGLKNSQFFQSSSNGGVKITPKIFSPNNDGFQDNVNISYLMQKEGNIGSIEIYDSQGRLIRHLENNELLGFSGTFTWDGTNDKGEKAHVGSYIILFNIHHLKSGTKQTFKNVCVIATKNN